MTSDTPSCETPTEAPQDLSELFSIYSRKTSAPILQARLCFLTSPEPGQILLNLQTQGGEFARIVISRDHLAGLFINGVGMLVEGKVA